MIEKKKQLTSEVLQNTLNYFTNVVNPKIEYIVFFGTLLGIIRENRLISKDDDIDLLIPIRYKSELLKNLSNSKIIIDQKNEVNQGKFFLQGRYLDKNIESLIDFYFYEERNNKSKIILKSIHGPIQDIKRHWLYIDKKILFPKQEMLFNGNIIFTPHQPEKVLHFLYGKNWKVKIERDNYRLIFLMHRTYVISNPLLVGLYDEIGNFKRHKRILKSIKTLYYLIPKKIRAFIKKLFN